MELDSDVNMLTDFEKEEVVLTTSTKSPLVAGTHSCQPYLKRYDEALPEPTESAQELVKEPVEQRSKATPERPREVRYNKPINKGKVEEFSQQFHFDVLNQLANIPTRITLYELLHLSKPTREALREALADTKILMTQVPTHPPVGELQSLHVSQTTTNIVFTPEDMQIKREHDRPLYFTSYSGSTEIACI